MQMVNEALRKGWTETRAVVRTSHKSEISFEINACIIMSALRSRCGHYIFAQWSANTGRNKSQSAHHRTTLSGCIFATSTIGKIVKQQYLPHMSLQYGELRPTNGWDLLASLGHPSKFQRVSRRGSVTARHSSSGRQRKFAALNRGRNLYSAGRPSRWALAHILVFLLVFERKYFAGWVGSAMRVLLQNCSVGLLLLVLYWIL